MRQLTSAAIPIAVLLAAGLTRPATAQDLEGDKSWDQVVSKKRSIVLGRFEGQFEGPQFKQRRIKLLDIQNDRIYFLEVGEGLGFIEELVPPGTYTITGLEAIYFPRGGAMDRKFRPVKQRFFVSPKEGDTVPSFEVPADRPAYIGTIQADVASEGIVHKGHYWRVLDEYNEIMERIRETYPKFAASLSQRALAPARNFALKPSQPEPVLEFIGVEDPIEKSRAYIDEGKFESAIHWLATFLPASDAERLEAELLIGEALLGQEKYDDAIERLGDVLQAAPGKIRALRLLARAHALNGNLEDAQGLFEVLVEMHPRDTEAHLQLGYLYALGADPLRSAEEFTSAFSSDTDYLLHDAAPFVVALRAVESQSAQYQPPEVKEAIQPPSWLRSRRNAQDGGMALLIDHEGRVVAAQLTTSSGPLPFMLVALVRAHFEPAAVNGVPVPAVLALPGGRGSQ